MTREPKTLTVEESKIPGHGENPREDHHSQRDEPEKLCVVSGVPRQAREQPL